MNITDTLLAAWPKNLKADGTFTCPACNRATLTVDADTAHCPGENRAFTTGDLLNLLQQARGNGKTPPKEDQQGRANTGKTEESKAGPRETEEEQIAACSALIGEVVAADFMSIELPPREYLIHPLLYHGQNSMIFAKPGVGKTNLGLAMGIAVSSGGPLFGPYTVPKPTGVIYFDAEMPAAEMQERIGSLWLKYNPTKFKIISSELLSTQCKPVPNLVNHIWRAGILEFIKTHPEYQLLILDNLSSLTPGCDENSGADWDAINQWLLSIRRLGASVMLVHHAGKGGDQRGVSKREDQLDLILKLTKIENRKVNSFRVDFQKGRSLPEKEKKPFVIEMVERTDGTKFMVHKPLDDDELERIAFLSGEGWNQKAIAGELGISQGAVSKKLAKAKIKGLLQEDGGLTQWGEACCSTMNE